MTNPYPRRNRLWRAASRWSIRARPIAQSSTRGKRRFWPRKTATIFGRALLTSSRGKNRAIMDSLFCLVSLSFGATTVSDDCFKECEAAHPSFPACGVTFGHGGALLLVCERTAWLAQSVACDLRCMGETRASLGIGTEDGAALQHPGLRAAHGTACKRYAPPSAPPARACAEGFVIGVRAFVGPGGTGAPGLGTWRAAARKADALLWQAQNAPLAPWDRQRAWAAAAAAESAVETAARAAKSALETAAQAAAEAAVKATEAAMAAQGTRPVSPEANVQALRR